VVSFPPAPVRPTIQEPLSGAVDWGDLVSGPFVQEAPASTPSPDRPATVAGEQSGSPDLEGKVADKRGIS
jgi:hypothetical protein